MLICVLAWGAKLGFHHYNWYIILYDSYIMIYISSAIKFYFTWRAAYTNILTSTSLNKNTPAEMSQERPRWKTLTLNSIEIFRARMKTSEWLGVKERTKRLVKMTFNWNIMTVGKFIWIMTSWSVWDQCHWFNGKIGGLLTAQAVWAVLYNINYIFHPVLTSFEVTWTLNFITLIVWVDFLFDFGSECNS